MCIRDRLYACVYYKIANIDVYKRQECNFATVVLIGTFVYKIYENTKTTVQYFNRCKIYKVLFLYVLILNYY